MWEDRGIYFKGKDLNQDASLNRLQYFGYLMRRANSLEKFTLMPGKIEDRRGQQRMKLLDGLIDSVDMSLSKLWEIMKDRGAWCATGHGVTESA